MLQFNFSPFPPLSTEHLNLRQMHSDDANEMFFLRSDKEVMKYIARPLAKTVAEAAAFIQMLNDNTAANEGITWAITLKNNNKLIGNIGFWRMDKENHRAEIGYILHPAYQGKGVMHEAVKAVLSYGFSHMKLHTVQACTDPLNIASMKLLERNGFINEGFFKEDCYFNGSYLDTVVYSLIGT